VLPERLSVNGTLDMRGTDITGLPEGLSVGGGVFLPDGTWARDVVEARQQLANKRAGKPGIRGLSPG
jgi:hypothetical protein